MPLLLGKWKKIDSRSSTLPMVPTGREQAWQRRRRSAPTSHEKTSISTLPFPMGPVACEFKLSGVCPASPSSTHSDTNKAASGRPRLLTPESHPPNRLWARFLPRPGGWCVLPDQVPRSRSMERIWPMARVGLSPLGQTLTQFMMPWHRNRLNGSSIRASRSSVASSRLSARKR